MKTILVTGATGMLGSDIVRSFQASPNYEVYSLSRSVSPLLPQWRQFIVDLARPNAGDLISFSPDVIVHTAALTDLNLCERDPVLAQKINVDGTRQLAAAAGTGTLFIYISTDSVFDGEKGNYSEHDKPNPLNAYSRSKFDGEQALLEEHGGTTVILRTNIYGFHNPLKNSLAEWAFREWRAGRKIVGFTDTVFNAVFTRQLADVISFIIDHKVRERILNVGSNSALSKFEFLGKLRGALGVPESLLEPDRSDKFPSAVRRPRNTSLNTNLLSKYLMVPDFESGIQQWIGNAERQGVLQADT